MKEIKMTQGNIETKKKLPFRINLIIKQLLATSFIVC